MNDPVYYCRYFLNSAMGLNARSQRSKIEGGLIRVGSGVGCIHPWVELGDEPLDAQLDALRDSEPCRLGERALQCARLDGDARAKGVSLFEGLVIPNSHLTVVPGMELRKQDLEPFSRIKLKGDADLGSTKESARKCLAKAAENCCLRIDFNEVLDASAAMNLAQVLGGEICERIEFIEDPISFEAGAWDRLQRQTGLQLAVDRDCEKAAEEGAEVEWLIIKPAVVDPGFITSKVADEGGSVNLVVTSYMDHAIGQMFAAYEAAVLKIKYPDQLRECGLLTHNLFEGDEFFEAVSSKGPELVVPEGTGLGFDDQLEALPWKRLK